MRLGWLATVRRPGRVLATALAFTLAVLVIILIKGFADGLYHTYTAMVRNTPADIWVSEKGVKGVANSASLLPADLESQITGLPGVRSVTPLLSVPVIAEVGGRRVPFTLFGYDTDSGLGGPWSMDAGRRPDGPGEITLDTAFAADNRLGLGSLFSLVGREFQVVGLTSETSSFMSASAYAGRAEVGGLIGAPDRASFLLVQAEPGAEISRIQAQIPPQYAAHTGEHLRLETEEFLTRSMGAPLNLLLGVAFLVGLAVISLTTYAGILERQAEYGVLRALGMADRSLAAVVLTEVMVSALAGLGVGTVAASLLARLVGLWLPAYPILITWSGLALTLALGLLMGLLAVLLPLRRLVRLDPAAIFRV